MKVKYFITLISTLSIFGACQKEDTPNYSVGEEGTTLILSGGGFNSEQTRTSLGVPVGSSIPVLWKVGDNLGTYMSSNDILIDVNVVALLNREEERGAGYQSGTFTAKVSTLEPNKDYTLGLYYPHFEFAGNDATTIYHRVFKLQTQSEGSNSEHIGLSGDFGYATAAYSTPSNLSGFTPEVNFTLQHKSSYLWLDITSADESEYSDWLIKQIVIDVPSGKYISGDTKYDIASDSYSIKESSSKKYNSVSLQIASGITISSTTPTSAHIVVVPCDMAGEQLNITYLLEKSDGSASKYIEHSRTIPATSTAFQSGVTYKLSEVLPTEAGSGWTFLSNTTPIALDDGGTANSYIVSTPGSYSFSATTIGNGVEGLLGLPSSTTQFHTEDVTINPVSAELIWQTSPALIENVSLSDGRVYFTKGLGTKGNALIAVKDGDGVILWSWHIWCTDSPKPQTYINDAGYSFEVMDRALGAKVGLNHAPETNIDNDASLGLHYQFGRKDPFIGVAYVGSSQADATFKNDGSAYSWPTRLLTDATIGTIAYTIKNPAQYIYGPNTTPYDWFQGKGTASGIDTRGFYLWGNPYGYWHGTEVGNSPNTPRSPQKSIYDPCPNGWMVAPRNTFTGLSTANVTLVAQMGALVYYQSATKSGPAAWFPFTGRYNHTSATGFTGSGNYSYTWLSSFRHKNTYSPSLFQMGGGAVTPTNNMYATYGIAVRCVQQY